MLLGAGRDVISDFQSDLSYKSNLSWGVGLWGAACAIGVWIQRVPCCCVPTPCSAHGQLLLALGGYPEDTVQLTLNGRG